MMLLLVSEYLLVCIASFIENSCIKEYLSANVPRVFVGNFFCYPTDGNMRWISCYSLVRWKAWKYVTCQFWLNTSRKWRHHASTNCVNSIRYVFQSDRTRRSAGTLVRSFETWLRQLSFSRSAKVSNHATSTCSERSSASDSQPTDERTRDTSPEAARLSSGLQIVHHDALNPHWPVSVWRILLTWCMPSLSTGWGPVCDLLIPLNILSRIVALSWSSTVTPLYHWLKTFQETFKSTLF